VAPIHRSADELLPPSISDHNRVARRWRYIRAALQRPLSLRQRIKQDERDARMSVTPIHPSVIRAPLNDNITLP
jgi:hypothetical protein